MEMVLPESVSFWCIKSKVMSLGIDICSSIDADTTQASQWVPVFNSPLRQGIIAGEANKTLLLGGVTTTCGTR